MRALSDRLRLLVLVVVAVGLVLGWSPAAAAQPVALTAELCDELDGDGDLTVEAQEAAELMVDLTGDAAVDDADFAVAEGECPALLEEGESQEPVELTFELCSPLDGDFDFTVTAEEAAALTIDLTGDGTVDAEDVAVAQVECPGLLLDPSVIPPTPGLLTLELCRALDDDENNDVPLEEAAALESDLDGDSDVDHADILAANMYCGPELLLGNTATLQIIKFFCTGIDRHTVTVSEHDAADVPLFPQDVPDMPAGCELGVAEFVVTDGAGQTTEWVTDPESVESTTGYAVGEGTVVERETGLEATVELQAGVGTVVAFFNKVKDEEEPPVQQPTTGGGTTGGGTAGGGTTGGGTSSGTTDLYNCTFEDFPTHALAQAEYERDRSDPHGLDGPVGPDNDTTGTPDLACENLLQGGNGPTSTTSNTGPVVTALPNTGHGPGDAARPGIVVLVGVLSLLTLAVSIARWQRRTT